MECAQEVHAKGGFLMRRNPAVPTLLILAALLTCSACAPLRTLGPEVPHEARVPDILLGPYNAPEETSFAVVTTSDHLRDLQAAGHWEDVQRIPASVQGQPVTSSDYLRDLQAAGALK
jgi:hypothetical protein